MVLGQKPRSGTLYAHLKLPIRPFYCIISITVGLVLVVIIIIIIIITINNSLENHKNKET